MQQLRSQPGNTARGERMSQKRPQRRRREQKETRWILLHLQHQLSCCSFFFPEWKKKSVKNAGNIKIKSEGRGIPRFSHNYFPFPLLFVLWFWLVGFDNF